MLRFRSLVAAALALVACGGNPAATCDGGCAQDLANVPTTLSKIHHLVVIVQENKSFDAYYGQWCTAPVGSNPTCTSGPACCEKGPDKDPGTGALPTVLDDKANAAYSPNHEQACELSEMDGGKMDGYVSASCGSPNNFAYVDPLLVVPYRNFAMTYALADRYFQPVVGQSSSNDMYFARAKFVFLDNSEGPKGAVGDVCDTGTDFTTYDDTTIGDLLDEAGVSWAWYGEGYDAMVAANKSANADKRCPPPPPDCPAQVSLYPCLYDPTDVPFNYYVSGRDTHTRDYQRLFDDLKNGTLPSVSFVKGLGYHTEHPALMNTISDGVKFVTSTVNAVLASPLASETLVIFTYDEGGGYFDHVAPPGISPVDKQPLGTRVPTMAIGPFAKKNYISHVTMEHSSIVKFIEWNWLGGQTGQLNTRDLYANNIGDLIDESAAGTTVPAN